MKILVLFEVSEIYEATFPTAYNPI